MTSAFSQTLYSSLAHHAWRHALIADRITANDRRALICYAICTDCNPRRAYGSCKPVYLPESLQLAITETL